MDKLEEYRISVVNLTNPHLFWYKEQNADDENENALNAHMQQLQFAKKLIPINKNDIIIDKMLVMEYHYLNKFIRATAVRIIDLPTGIEYIMWADDLGFCIKTSPQYVYALPKNFNYKSKIMRGGIAQVVPITRAFDPMRCCEYTCRSKIWSNNACRDVLELIQSADIVCFKPSFIKNNHSWGDLIVIEQGVQINVAELLLKKEYSQIGTNFELICDKQLTWKFERWQNNTFEEEFKTNDIKYKGEGEKMSHLLKDMDYISAWFRRTSVTTGLGPTAPVDSNDMKEFRGTALGPLATCGRMYFPKRTPPIPPSICFEVQSVNSTFDCESFRQQAVASDVKQTKPKADQPFKNVVHLPAGYDLQNLHEEQQSIQKQKEKREQATKSAYYKGKGTHNMGNKNRRSRTEIASHNHWPDVSSDDEHASNIRG